MRLRDSRFGFLFFLLSSAVATWLTGCAAVVGETADTWVDVTESPPPRSPPVLWMSETSILSPDGIRTGAVAQVAIEVAGRVNEAFAKEWVRISVPEASSRVPSTAVTRSLVKHYGRSVTLPRAAQLGDDAIARVVSRFDGADGRGLPLEAGASVIRHQAWFNVFSDSVELQLFSVITVIDSRGRAQWQGGVRSTKQFDAWIDGDALAALSASFVAAAVSENARNLARLYRKAAVDSTAVGF